MKELLEQIENYLDVELEDSQLAKLLGHNPEAGEKVEIFWVDRESPDYGYTFRLPMQDEDSDMLDLCVHITHVDNSDGMDEAPQEWIHLVNLLENERVEQIIFS